jgi:hypothetical protein
MNTDYYHWGPLFRNETGEWVNGYFTGSSHPMRFVDQQGRILRIYQQETELVDEHLLAYPYVSDDHAPKFGVDGALQVSQKLLRSTLASTHGAIAGIFHVDSFFDEGIAGDSWGWLEGTLDCAVELGIPIWSAQEWLRFSEARHDTVVKEVRWDSLGANLSFVIVVPPRSEADLTVMVPKIHGDLELAEARLDGQAVRVRERTVGGVRYGWTTLEPGAHQVEAAYA